jgi:CBS domain-containing protein
MNTGKEEYLEIKNLKAKDIMKSPVISMKKDDSVKDIALQLISGPFSGTAITDDKERVIGIVTEYDILNQARKGKDLENLKAEDVMQHNPVNVDVNTPLHDILEIMIEHGILRIPVTDSLSLVGNISRSDILKIIIEQ